MSVDAVTRLVLWRLAVDPDVHWRVTYENGRSATEESLERRWSAKECAPDRRLPSLAD
jgi:hypothetical protein